MHSLSGRWNLNPLLVLILLSCQPKKGNSPTETEAKSVLRLVLDTFNILNVHKLSMTSTYCLENYEYKNKLLQHYSLFKSLNPVYQPYTKPDPGEAFMKKIREQLKAKYALELES